MSDWTDPRFSPEPTKALKGFMTEEHTVWCGCLHWNQFPGTKTQVAALAKKKGWVLTRDSGWMCSRCAAKRRTNKEHK